MKLADEIYKLVRCLSRQITLQTRKTYQVKHQSCEQVVCKTEEITDKKREAKDYLIPSKSLRFVHCITDFVQDLEVAFGKVIEPRLLGCQGRVQKGAAIPPSRSVFSMKASPNSPKIARSVPHGSRLGEDFVQAPFGLAKQLNCLLRNGDEK